MSFTPAKTLSDRTNPKNATNLNLRQRVHSALEAVIVGNDVTVAGFCAHPDRATVIRELEDAGYTVAFPYRDMGDTAVISW